MSEVVYQLDDLGGRPGVKKPRGADPSPKDRMPAVLALAMEWGMWIAIIVGGLALAYFVMAIAAGPNYGVAWFGWFQLQGDGPHGINHAERAHMLGNLRLAGALLVISMLYLCIYTVLSAYNLQDRFFLMLLMFVLFHFGSVFLFSSVLPDYLNLYPGGGQTNKAAELILYFLERAGDACLVVAGFRLVAALVSLMRHGRNKLKVVTEQKIKEGPATGAAARIKPVYRAFRRCWETSYCQEYLLKVCPAWQAKKTCWKFGSGCMCDSTMLDRLIRIEMGTETQSTRTAARVPRSRYYGGPNKCHTCPIYLTHEEEKYRLINPLVLVTVLALLVVYWDKLGEAYQLFAVWVAHVIAAIAFGPTAFLAKEWTDNLLDPFVQTSLVICGAVVLVSQCLRFVEWAILEKKL